MSNQPKKTSKSGKSANMGQAKNQASSGPNQGARGLGQGTNSQKTKESFQKKLLICQKVYDYKDESKDVKGKTERLNAINEI